MTTMGVGGLVVPLGRVVVPLVRVVVPLGRVVVPLDDIGALVSLSVAGGGVLVSPGVELSCAGAVRRGAVRGAVLGRVVNSTGSVVLAVSRLRLSSRTFLTIEALPTSSPVAMVTYTLPVVVLVVVVSPPGLRAGVLDSVVLLPGSVVRVEVTGTVVLEAEVVAVVVVVVVGAAEVGVVLLLGVEVEVGLVVDGGSVVVTLGSVITSVNMG